MRFMQAEIQSSSKSKVGTVKIFGPNGSGTLCYRNFIFYLEKKYFKHILNDEGGEK